MDKRQIGTKLIIDHLGLDIQMENFEDRLILQKAIYLAQASGVGVGYFFSWYLRGPYCSALAEDGFALDMERKNGLREIKNWHLSDSLKNLLSQIRDWFSGDKGQIAKKAELLASVHFLMDRKKLTDASAIHHVCEEYKKGFSLEEVKGAMRELKEHGLIQ